MIYENLLHGPLKPYIDRLCMHCTVSYNNIVIANYYFTILAVSICFTDLFYHMYSYVLWCQPLLCYSVDRILCFRIMLLIIQVVKKLTLFFFARIIKFCRSK